MREAPSERGARALCRAGQHVNSSRDLGLVRISINEIDLYFGMQVQAKMCKKILGIKRGPQGTRPAVRHN